MPFFAPRDAETTLPCPECKSNLHIARTCHVVYMQCPHCHKKYDLQQFIARADESMEHFLENVYCDRI